jgi:hypothetical protein
MNSFIFKTGGDWDSTTLYNNGQEVPAMELLVNLDTGRDEYGNPMKGGIAIGGTITAYVVPQDDTSQQIGIFPGRLQLDFPRHSLVIENTHPTFAFEFTQVLLDGNDVTHNVMSVDIDVNAGTNEVTAAATIFKPHWFTSNEVATFDLLG